ncbi:flagellar basal body-associated FliL family protein [Lentibacter algarum]|uniref:flagellar basal body-associated FliL family protein n=1 Tax=Lentibacter algarum TaxID=576131 RepID=UPI001C06F219|nr:flagellar basal body-associated FliL family protein [Lentibacter algarum]MBU2981188.1 flagellar basal body-associated FliL family protein [Lentibacter algarum]
MDESEAQAVDAPKKKSKMPMIIGLLLALAGGGGGFFAVYSGIILGPPSHADEEVEDHAGDLPDIAFVELTPLTVSLFDNGRDRHLRFRAQLETPGQYQGDVEKLLPRIVDVLNSYLRAVELDDLKDSAALVRLRAQMLRRVQIVVGEGRINDLLIMEFVLN